MSDAYRRIREHLTEAEMDKLLAALKRNRHGHRDWLIGLVIYRLLGLRVSDIPARFGQPMARRFNHPLPGGVCRSRCSGQEALVERFPTA